MNRKTYSRGNIHQIYDTQKSAHPSSCVNKSIINLIKLIKYKFYKHLVIILLKLDSRETVIRPCAVVEEVFKSFT